MATLPDTVLLWIASVLDQAKMPPPTLEELPDTVLPVSVSVARLTPMPPPLPNSLDWLFDTVESITLSVPPWPMVTPPEKYCETLSCTRQRRSVTVVLPPAMPPPAMPPWPPEIARSSNVAGWLALNTESLPATRRTATCVPLTAEWTRVVPPVSAMSSAAPTSSIGDSDGGIAIVLPPLLLPAAQLVSAGVACVFAAAIASRSVQRPETCASPAMSTLMVAAPA